MEQTVSKVCAAQLINRASGAAEAARPGNAEGGITQGTAGGKKIVIACDSAVDLSAANADLCLIVHVILA
jgi:hypothetical protein